MQPRAADKNGRRPLLFAEFEGTAEGGVNRLAEGCAEAAFFKGLERGGGGAAGRGDLGAEISGMATGGLLHAHGADQGLARQELGGGAREADAHAGVGPGFEDQVGVGGTAGADGGGHVDMTLVPGVKLGAERAEDAAGFLKISWGGTGGGGPEGDAGADLGRGIGNGADDPGGVEMGAESAEAGASDYGNDELVILQRGKQAGADLFEVLWLDGEEYGPRAS